MTSTIGKVGVSIPGIGLDFELSEPERAPAWELYVELATRVVTWQGTPTDIGSVREILSSLHSLFFETRKILRESAGVLSRADAAVGHVAITFLSGTLRDYLTKWHTRLLLHEEQRPAAEGALTWERAWRERDDALAELAEVRAEAQLYADFLRLHLRDA